MNATPILPNQTDLNRPFWEAAKRGTLVIQKCSQCEHLRWPISPICPRCLDPQYEWLPVSGDGEVFSYTVFRHAYHPYWAERLPYVVAIVRLAEGPRLISDIYGAVPEDVTVGATVRACFVPADNDVTVPRFALTETA
jgi:uncharacterized protein